MQENNQPPVIQTSLFLWYSSLVLFLLIVGGTIGVYIFGTYIDVASASRRNDIAQIEKQITEATQDRKTLIYQTISNNAIRPSLDLKNIVSQFRIAAAKVGVGFQGFSITDDTISTVLVATSGDNQIHPDPVSTIIGMMREYASHNDLYFTLDPITSVSGDLSKRVTAIKLHVTQAQ